jgi:hypothetical protein
MNASFTEPSAVAKDGNRGISWQIHHESPVESPLAHR